MLLQHSFVTTCQGGDRTRSELPSAAVSARPRSSRDRAARGLGLRVAVVGTREKPTSSPTSVPSGRDRPRRTAAVRRAHRGDRGGRPRRRQRFGPMHLADAFARPQVVLYSGTELESQWEPRRSARRLLQVPTPCSPCHTFTCPFSMECLDIDPDVVVAAALELLRHPLPAQGMPVRVLTWHVHGGYLRYLAEVPHEIVVPVKPGRPEGYGGRAGHDRWPDNLVEVPADEVPHLAFDAVLFQSPSQLARRPARAAHRRPASPAAPLPRARSRLASRPPTRAPVDDPEVLIVHVTTFDQLMSDNGAVPTTVIDHGVRVPPGARWTGDLAKGLVVTNGLATRGRRLGADLVERARDASPSTSSAWDQKRSAVSVRSRRRAASAHHEIPLPLPPGPLDSLGSPSRAMIVGLPVVGSRAPAVTVVEDGWSASSTPTSNASNGDQQLDPRPQRHAG